MHINLFPPVSRHTHTHWVKHTICYQSSYVTHCCIRFLTVQGHTCTNTDHLHKHTPLLSLKVLTDVCVWSPGSRWSLTGLCKSYTWCSEVYYDTKCCSHVSLCAGSWVDHLDYRNCFILIWHLTESKHHMSSKALWNNLIKRSNS